MMTAIRQIPLCAALLFLLNAAPPCAADYISDQSFEPSLPAGADYSVFPLQDLAQSFTVGQSGKLGIVDVLISSSFPFGAAPLVFDIRPTLNGVPLADDGSALVTRSSVAGSLWEEWFRFDFSDTPIPVSAGEILAIVLRSPDSFDGSYSWAGDPFGTYPGGEGFGRDPTVSAEWGGPGRSLGDVGFRTFVNPVPEPSSLVLLVLGLGTFGAGVTWRKRKPAVGKSGNPF
jgi:PEP-CTERM motif